MYVGADYLYASRSWARHIMSSCLFAFLVEWREVYLSKGCRPIDHQCYQIWMGLRSLLIEVAFRVDICTLTMNTCTSISCRSSILHLYLISSLHRHLRHECRSMGWVWPSTWRWGTQEPQEAGPLRRFRWSFVIQCFICLCPSWCDSYHICDVSLSSVRSWIVFLDLHQSICPCFP
jgi:hypothetical protein